MRGVDLRRIEWNPQRRQALQADANERALYLIQLLNHVADTLPELVEDGAEALDVSTCLDLEAIGRSARRLARRLERARFLDPEVW